MKPNSLWADLYGSWLMSRENSPYYSVCFCAHEKQLKGIHRRLPAASCFGGFTGVTVTWERRVLSCSMQTPELISRSTERKTFWGWHLQQASLVSLMFTKIGKTLIKIE